MVAGCHGHGKGEAAAVLEGKAGGELVAGAGTWGRAVSWGEGEFRVVFDASDLSPSPVGRHRSEVHDR